MLDTSARLKKLRGSMSQEEIATSLGIHRNTWARWESGKGEPDLTVLGKIAQKMRISLEWLIMGTGQMHQDATPVSTPPPLCENEDVKASDSRKSKGDICHQLIENNSKENIDTAQNVRLSETLGQQHKGTHAEKVMELQERLLSSQERLLSLTEQNAELRLQLERRDMRIHELEKENSLLREARKGAAPVFRAAAGDAG